MQKGSVIIGFVLVLAVVAGIGVWWWQGDALVRVLNPQKSVATSTSDQVSGGTSEWLIAIATSTYEHVYPEGVCRFVRLQGQHATEHLIGECRLAVATDTPTGRYVLYANGKDVLSRIHVENTGGQTQDIVLTDDDIYEGYDDPEYIFALMDINFDGYKDIRFGTGWGNHGDIGYGFRVYDPKTKSFLRNDQFLAFENPVVDLKSKCIYESHTYISPVDYSSSTCLRGDQMILVEREQRESKDDGTGCYRVTKERRQPDGSMQTTVTEECDRG